MDRRAVAGLLGLAVLFSLVLALLWRPEPVDISVHVPVAAPGADASVPEPQPEKGSKVPVRQPVDPAPPGEPVVDEAADDGLVEVFCPVSWPEGVDVAGEAFAVGALGQPGVSATYPAEAEASGVRFRVPADSDSGTLMADDYAVAALIWTGGRCIAGNPRMPTHTVTGVVRGASDNDIASLRISVCGRSAKKLEATEAGVTFQVRTDHDGPCRVRVYRTSGAFQLPAETVIVEPAAGDAFVDVDFPDYEPAGMGVTFGMTERGATVEAAVAGSPAEAAGLQPGDVILDVDGEVVAGMTEDDFLTWGLGPEGSEVVLTVLTEGGEREVVLTRAKIERRR